MSSELKSVRTELFMARSRLINHAEVVLLVLIFMFTLESFNKLINKRKVHIVET